ncbi:hypothetical protein PYW08_011295 [Mythimna loreyi]|uniref:Uncharacterized protein n=1 Tax=Mythimna loreyi TaxID=667449 RepID=A0ACC2Q465_9NEOP|nr:hypothetical protein PYW08_011295 [Mythimna loreyi]
MPIGKIHVFDLDGGENWPAYSCNAAFEEIKVRLTSDPVLAHYSPALPLVLAVDSSAYGLGAVLAQRHADGSERLVCCASRTLNAAERRYSQVDKEALAIVYGREPAVALLGRRLRMRLDLLRGSTGDAVEAAQIRQVERAQGTNREVQPGERVLFRDYSRNNPKWVEGEVSERTGAVTYKVKSDQGEYRKHIDQIMPLRRHTRYSNPTITETTNQNTEKETYVSVPNSPSPSSLQNPHDSPVIHESQSDYTVEPSTSGDWVNNKPRNRSLTGIDID